MDFASRSLDEYMGVTVETAIAQKRVPTGGKKT